MRDVGSFQGLGLRVKGQGSWGKRAPKPPKPYTPKPSRELGFGSSSLGLGPLQITQPGSFSLEEG